MKSVSIFHPTESTPPLPRVQIFKILADEIPKRFDQVQQRVESLGTNIVPSETIETTVTKSVVAGESSVHYRVRAITPPLSELQKFAAEQEAKRLQAITVVS